MEKYFKFSTDISQSQIFSFLEEMDSDFNPRLSERVVLQDYASKLFHHASCYSIIDENFGGKVIASIFVYKNQNKDSRAYIPVVGVLKQFRSKGLIKILFSKVEEDLIKSNFRILSLETWLGSKALLDYLKNGFYITESKKDRANEGVSIHLDKSLFLHTEHIEFSPTPVCKAINLSDELQINLLIKHDDLFMIEGGGSKARKASYIISKAVKNGCNAIVTAGGSQSNHLRACAIMARKFGIEMTAVIHDVQPARFEGNLKLLSILGVKLVFIDMETVKIAMNVEIEEYVTNGRRPFYIWGGGHSDEGTFSYYRGVGELRSQLGNWEPDYIVVASGTGTTQAGIEMGVREIYPKCKVLGVSVAREKIKGEKAVIDAANKLIPSIGGHLPSLKSVFFDDKFMGSGYESTYPELIKIIKHAASSDGLILDPTYTAKAFIALTHYVNEGVIAKNSNVIFWHTGGLMNLMSSHQI